MPNGGVHHCGHCKYYSPEVTRCELRGASIDSSHWTTCKDFNRTAVEPTGPIYAIVCEVINGAASYADIPYFDNVRVDTGQGPTGGDTLVYFTETNGAYHEFATVEDYLTFYTKSGRQY
jgi:hypothetical protein